MAGAEEDLYTELGYAAIAAMTPDERSEKLWKKFVDIVVTLTMG